MGCSISRREPRARFRLAEVGDAFTHPGAAGVAFWVDPTRELGGVYFEVCMRVTDEWNFLWNYDLFENAIPSAVDE